MGEYTRIRRRVGVATVAVGGGTFAYMIIANAYEWPTLSLVYLLPLVMGAALLVGTTSTVRAMTWCIALYGTVLLGSGIAIPVIEPWSITKASMRAEPMASIVRNGYQLFLVGFLVWAYRSLRRPQMLEAMQARGVSTARPSVAFALGGLFLIAVVTLEYKFQYSEEAVTARTQARLEHGLDRVYEVTRLLIGDRSVTAVLKAYGPTGVETVSVDWGSLPSINPWISPPAEPCGSGDGDERC